MRSRSAKRDSMVKTLVTLAFKESRDQTKEKECREDEIFRVTCRKKNEINGKLQRAKNWNYARRRESNLPDEHGVLINSLLSLLGVQGSHAAGSIEEHSARDAMQQLVRPVIRIAPGSLPLRRTSLLPVGSWGSCIGRRGGSTLAFWRQAGAHPEGPDYVE